MRRSFLTRAGVALAALTLSTTAHAVDLQVSYTVDDKALKAAVTGTFLNFELYSDFACTASVDSTVVPIDDVDVIERVKRFKPKGGVKPPSTARLVHQLLGMLATAPTLYLKVTGTGITALGGDCQLQYASADTTGASIPCLTQVGNEVYFNACNVNIRSGSGSTNGALNGLGNLVVGYNEDTFGPPNNRTGSHNLVVGPEHTYSSYGGLVAGEINTVSGAFASVTGGRGNVASASWTSISAGDGNTANGPASSVSGGSNNIASGNKASISGGGYNTASNNLAAVSGGGGNTASGDQSWVSGGQFNVANAANSSVSGGQSNTASSSFSSVSGGQCNVAGAGPAPSCTASAGTSSVSGGFMNVASADGASVSGGECNVAGAGPAPGCGGTFSGRSSVTGGFRNVASSYWTTVTGGFSNLASNEAAVVTGGSNNTASGVDSTVSGGHLRSALGGDDWRAGSLLENN